MTCTTCTATDHATSQSGRIGPASRWYETVGLWVDRRRQRKTLRELAGLDDALLKDIGLCPEEAMREAAKPFWMP